MRENMDFPLYELDYQPSGSYMHPVKNTTCTPNVYEKVPRPVADRMLHLISQKVVPSGFDSAGFVNNSFVGTFGQGLHQATACSASEWDTLGLSAKRKRCSVVDSALGIMGYDSLKVCDTKGRFLVDMLTSLIQSKSSCGLVCGYLGGMEGPNSSLRCRKFRGQFCAQRISVGTLLQIVDNCKSFFASVKYGTQAQEVMEALVKVATDTCLFSPRAESVSGVFNKAIYNNEGQRRKDNMWALQSVIDFALEQKQSIYSKLRPCSRLRFWRIRPSCLKQDISSLANEAMLRLLLPLDRDLCQREEWAILVVCLSLAPEIFMEARRLLHHWLLSSGAVRLWELRAELVAAVWDVVSHPSVWGLRNDIHLPPKFAFYSVVLRPFVQILEGPPTILGVLRLLNLLDDAEGLQCQAGADTSGQRPLSQSFNDVDHDSIWSLLIEFPPWFLFTTKLLFRNLKTFSSGREMYESLVYSGELEAVPFGSEYDFEHFCSKVAARYLAWIIRPANRLQRASEERMLLMLNCSWGKFQNSLSQGTSLLLSVQHEYGALKAAVQASCMKCTKCGSPVKEVLTADEVCGKEREAPNICGMKFSSLNLWLAHVQRTFEVNVTATYTEEKLCAGGEDATRIGRSSTTNSARKSATFMAHYLPLAALSESLQTCTFDTVISVLQFVASCGGHCAHSNEHAHQGDYETRVQYLLECNSCRALLHNKRRCSQHKERQDGPLAASSQRDKESIESKGGSQLYSRRSPDWIPGVAAVLSILDSLDGDVLLLEGSGSSDLTGDKQQVTDNLAVIVAEYVKEWARCFEVFFSETSLSFEENATYTITLQDMHCRFCRWIDKLSLSEEVAKICNDIKGNLAMRIKNVKSSPLTP